MQHLFNTLCPSHATCDGCVKLTHRQSPLTFSRNTSSTCRQLTHTPGQRTVISKTNKSNGKKSVSPPLFFLAAASMLGSPTSFGSFLISSRQTREKATHIIPDAHSMALQLYVWASTVAMMGPKLPARFMLQERTAHHVPN